MAETYWAWTQIYNGGEVTNVAGPNGQNRKIVTKRNIIEPGTKVLKKDFSDADWENLVKGGSVRDYAFPDIPATWAGSPQEYVMHELRQGQQDVPQDTLLKLALTGGLPFQPSELPAGVEKVE